MWRWMVTEWPQIYPNLIAEVLWVVPMWAWHHSRLRKHVTRELAELREELRERVN